MKTKPIERQFLRMGARIKIQPPAPPRNPWTRPATDYALDIQKDRRGEHFVLTVPPEQEEVLEASVLQTRPGERHLLLMVREESGFGARRANTRDLAGKTIRLALADGQLLALLDDRHRADPPAQLTGP
ncbi:MAG: hypothetical protein GY953_18695, partial [bacterium]|nr:hypothetical protein [bacterium]